MVYRVEPACFPEDFPERLEAFRVAAGLSRRELARQLRADVRLLKRWKNGTRPDSANLLALFGLASGMGLLHLLLPESGTRESENDGVMSAKTTFECNKARI